MVTKREWIALAIVAVLLALIGWEEHRKALDNAVAEAKAQSDVAAEAKVSAALKQVADQKSELDRAQQLQTAALAKLTVPQITVKLPEVVPAAPTPLKVLDASSPAVASGAAKPGDVLVPKEDVRPIAAKLLEGQQCAAQLGLCQQQIPLLQQKFDLKSDEAVQWKKAAKGGSVLKRAGKVVVILGIGGALGYAAHH